MELKPGDVVILKSGGHPVTVAEVHENTVECLWMGADGDLFRETLPIAVLEPAEPDDSDDDEDGDDEDDEDEDRKSKVA
ncbi:YodC family protein [Bradyrhizobium sp.]|uniref:YodC family protein n=1 Tax=Bradyrhizobium sp. TaxID=376 RepID=UPI003C74B5A5